MRRCEFLVFLLDRSKSDKNVNAIHHHDFSRDSTPSKVTHSHIDTRLTIADLLETFSCYRTNASFFHEKLIFRKYTKISDTKSKCLHSNKEQTFMQKWETLYSRACNEIHKLKIEHKIQFAKNALFFNIFKYDTFF